MDMSRIENAIRKAIKADERSRYAICKVTGIDPGHLCRFMAGTTGLSNDTAERLADDLGLQITISKRRKGGKGR